MRSSKLSLALRKPVAFTLFTCISLVAQVPLLAQCTNDNIAPVITPFSGSIKIILAPTGTKTRFNCSDKGQQTITVIATDGQFGSALTPNNVKFVNIGEIRFDLAGNLFIADIQNNRMRKPAPNGDVTTIAGNGAQGFTDVTGAGASLDQPSSFINNRI